MTPKEKAPTAIGAKQKLPHELYQRMTLEEILDQREWLKGYQILERLDHTMSSRTFRKWVERFNKQFDGRKQIDYVVHSSKGYKLTRDLSEIKRSINDNDKRAFTMLRQTRKTRRILGMKDQISLFEEEEGK